MFPTQALRQTRPGAQYVVWPRIDQKSCLKAIAAAGCVPLVVENLLEGDELRTDVAGVREKIASVGAEQARTRTRTCMCLCMRMRMRMCMRVCTCVWHVHVHVCMQYCARTLAHSPPMHSPPLRVWRVWQLRVWCVWQLRVWQLRVWQVLCVLSTTSCFAPRGVERLLDLARICLELDVPHFVNNAYGVQCTSCMRAIAAASKHGRLDLFIQARMPTPTLAMLCPPLRGLRTTYFALSIHPPRCAVL